MASPLKWCTFGKHKVVSSNFHRDASRADGLATYCKGCASIRENEKNARKRALNPEGFREKGRVVAAAWRAANPEQAAASRRARAAANPTRNQEYMRERYAANPEHFREAQRQYREANPAKYILGRVKRRARERGLAFDLVEADIEVPTHCPVLGIALTTATGLGQRDSSPSVDRIDSSGGYVRGNIRVISMRANRIKNDATVEELEKVLAYMRSSHG